jgi:hypothetical protein
MRSSNGIRAAARRVRLAAAAALLVLGAYADGAQAQSLIAGTAKGCFGADCTPVDNHRFHVDGVWLKYFSSTTLDFEGITTGGFLPINGYRGYQTGNFGVLSLGPTSPGTVINIPFTLSLGIINPDAPNTIFSAILTGYVTSLMNGGVLALFTPPSVTTAFTDLANGIDGSIKVTPFGVTVPSNGLGMITGQVQVSNLTPSTVTPEPVSIVLLGTGLLALALVQRRRRAPARASS